MTLDEADLEPRSSRSSPSCRWRASRITALIGRRLHKQAHWIPVLAVFASWLIAMVVASAR